MERSLVGSLFTLLPGPPAPSMARVVVCILAVPVPATLLLVTVVVVVVVVTPLEETVVGGERGGPSELFCGKRSVISDTIREGESLLPQLHSRCTKTPVPAARWQGEGDERGGAAAQREEKTYKAVSLPFSRARKWD